MVLNKYLYRTIGKPLLSSIAGCTFLLLIDSLSEIIEKIIVQRVPFLQILELFLYLMIHILSFTIPMGMMIGTLIAYGTMSSSNEIIALNSLGVSLYRIIKPSIIMGFGVSLTMIFIYQFISPAASVRSDDIQKFLVYNNPALGLVDRQFIDSIDGYSIYLNSFDSEKNLSGDFIIFSNEKRKSFPSVIKGKHAKWDSGYMSINNAEAFEIDNGEYKATVSFDEQKIPIRNKISSYTFLGSEDEGNRLSILALIITIIKMRYRSISAKIYELSLHTKLSLSFSAAVLGILGTLLSVGVHKRLRKGDGKISGIMVLFIYWVWIQTSKGLVSDNGMSVYILWIPNIIFLLIAFLIFLYKRRV